MEADVADFASSPCSREAPAADSGWTPSVLDVNQLEADLPQLLSRVNTNCCKVAHKPRLDKYFRQYVGFVRDGKRFIYVNAIPLTEVRDSHMFTDIEKKYADVCDGGASYWGALYNLEQRTLDHIAFSGTVNNPGCSCRTRITKN